MADRRVLRTKAAIREAFLALLQKKNAEEITVTELAREANIERKTFYLHYNNIQEIINEIETVVVEMIAEATKGLSVNSREFFAALTNVMSDNFDYFALIMQDPKYITYQNRSQSILRSALIAHYRETTSLDGERLERYADFYAAGISSIYINWCQNGQKLSLDDLTDFVYQIAVANRAFQK
jgi:Transcriptional regulator